MTNPRRRFIDTARTIRVSPRLLERAEELLEVMADDPDVHLRMGRTSVSAVVRVACLEGLELLEERYKEALEQLQALRELEEKLKLSPEEFEAMKRRLRLGETLDSLREEALER